MFAVIFVSIILIFSGYVVNLNNAHYLLAGYNTMSKKEREMIKNTKKNIIICDNDYVDGLPSIISSKIRNLANCKITLMGLPDKTAGHHSRNDVLPPNSDKIIQMIHKNR